MRVFVWSLRIVLFLVLLGFAVKNSGPVSLRFFFDLSWQLPLVAVMLIFFAGGAAFGVTAALASYLRQRREIAGLRHDIETAAGRDRTS